MVESQSKLLVQIRAISRISVLVGLVLTLVLGHNFDNSIHMQIAIALLALTVGIPHGAVDHLIAVPKLFSLRMGAFLIGYLSVVGIAIWLMLLEPLLGFQVIVLLSAVHFGVGDASFYMELYRRLGKSGFPRIVYALAAGSTPVIIPLVNTTTNQALTAVNSELLNWAGNNTKSLLVICISVNLGASVFLASKKFFGPTADLLLLLTVACIAPPLVAFALYFGLWHALRHTARLTLEYGPSLKMHSEGKTWNSFWVAVRAGLPAVAIVLAFTVFLAVGRVSLSDNTMLWYLLVVTWALTVPHMALTGKSDLKALNLV